MSTDELSKRTTNNIQEKANLIWAIADKLVGVYKPHEYGNVKQAKNSDVNMFINDIFPKYFEKIAQQCYMEQMDAFTKLFEDAQLYNALKDVMAKAFYFKFKNGEEEPPKVYEMPEETHMVANDGSK